MREAFERALAEEMAAPDSVSQRMQDQVPVRHRPVYVIGADMGGIAAVDATGIRVFLHQGGEEVELTARGFVSALSALTERNPALAEAVRQATPDLDAILHRARREVEEGGPLSRRRTRPVVNETAPGQ